MKRKVLLNTLFSVLLQITNIVVNLVLPRAIIVSYGSQVNGLVQSITQFLSVISFVELGMGAVVQSSLYDPITRKDNKKISQILTSGNRFYQTIAYILAGYVAVLIAVYPLLVNKSFDWLFTVLLIVAISITFFAQYYFGLIRSIFLIADLKGYIQYGLQILTLVLNTVVSIVLINMGQSIQVVKFASAIIFIIRPICLKIYIDKKYNVNFKEPYKEEPIKQKWNGVAQHVCAVVLDQTDTIVLTLFSTLQNVSIYSVYHLITFGVRSFYVSLTAGLQSAFGHIWARKDEKLLDASFSALEVGCHLLTIFMYSCTGILLIPFIRIYTSGINDANYINLSFGILLTVSRGFQCLRTPYNIMILASGHYKQTQRCYIIAAIMNIVLSIIFVFIWGLIGVAIGTLIALTYQTIWMVVYDYKYLVKRKAIVFIKQIIFDVVVTGVIIVATIWINMSVSTYIAWGLIAIIVALIAIIIISVSAFVFYNKETKKIIKYFKAKKAN